MTVITKHRAERDGGIEMTSLTIGNALVVHPKDMLSTGLRNFALGLAKDPEHELVVVDLPAGSPFSLWESAAALMPRRRRRGVRLVIGGRSRETTALAGQWLSERLNRPVIAPDGDVFPGVGGSLFVDAGRGSGWVRFQPGKTPHWEAKRFPRPVWESDSLAEVVATSSTGIAEPLPGGVWLRPSGPEMRFTAHRSRLLATLPCQPEVCTIVLGCPGAAPIALDDITRFWHGLPDAVRERSRLVQFGPVSTPDSASYGQALANSLGESIVFYAGIPVGSRIDPAIYTVQTDGTLGWRSFAQEFGYEPQEPGTIAPPPRLVSHRPPVHGVHEITPAVYWYAPDAVVEVVRAGLWLRPPHEPVTAAAVRSAPSDAGRHLLMFEAGTEEIARRMRMLAEDVMARLDDATRRLSGLVPSSAVLNAPIRISGRAMAALEPVAALDGPAPSAEPVLDAVEVPAESAPAVRKALAPAQSPAASAMRLESSPLPASDSFFASSPPPATPDPQRTVAESVADAMAIPASPSPGWPPRPAAEDPDPSAAASPFEQDTSRPTVIGPNLADDDDEEAEADAAVSDAVEEPEPADDVVTVTVVQPTPSTAAAALLPKRGLDEERTWLRRTLSREYATVANSVARVLSEHPGFQGALERSSGGVLTDAVAVRLYLSAEGDQVDLPLRLAEVGPHVPFARCVVSGLSRLPSHRGATVFSTSLTQEQWELYRSRKLFTEWGFINALTSPCSTQQGDTDVLMWSMTSRRTKLLEAEIGPTTDRVLFVPGTSFKVLDVIEPAEGARGQILLRELATGEIDDTGRVDRNRVSLDELAVNSLRRYAQTWAAAERKVRIAESAAARFQTLPGLVQMLSAESETR